MTQKPSPQSSGRWYDPNADIKGAVGGMETLPDEFQTVVAEGINTLAEKNHKAEDALKSLGKEKVMAIYKSKQKQRSYDRNPQFHRSMNYLFALPETSQKQLGKQFKDITGTVVDYVDCCKATQRQPEVDEARNMMALYVQSNGNKQIVDAYITQKYPEFEAARTAKTPESANPQASSLPTDLTYDETIAEDRSGMKVQIEKN